MLPYYVLINRENRLESNQRPQDLVEPGIVFAPGTDLECRLLRYEAAQYIERMFDEAKKQGIELVGVSGYRSYERQKELYENSLQKRGKEHTERYIAPPGASEHQSGLAMDISCARIDYELEECFEQTREGIWLAKNASLYGFVLRYPKNSEEWTGFGYEPWHIRYVTKPLAFYLTKLGLVLEQYQLQECGQGTVQVSCTKHS